VRPATYATLTADLDRAMVRQDTAEAIRLADQLDRLEPPRFSLALAALWYAGQGLRVFPLAPHSKKPWPRSHGLDDATTNLVQIEDWWRRNPESNVGIATGHLVDVIDFDGPHAHAAWGRQYPTWDDAGVHVLGTVSTPRSGGLHVYVPATGAGNSAGLVPGVDYRGLGGYVVAPPSVLDEQADQVAGTYKWLRPLGHDDD
jgi:hypothetical protein